ncbi:MAG: OB-fold domain-containing protein [Azospirillaceae bacterium]|nr:OB-fold domain-containing protein [Azospirillaceae bacterium]
MTTPTYQRTLPLLDDSNRFFWTSGAEGELRLMRCQECGHWLHPPGPLCPVCRSERLAAEAVSGLGSIETYTLNMRSWGPGLEVPYVVAIVHLDEQPGLRLTTNIVGIPASDVRIGMRVRVTFERDEDVWLPLFTPA